MIQLLTLLCTKTNSVWEIDGPALQLPQLSTPSRCHPSDHANQAYDNDRERMSNTTFCISLASSWSSTIARRAPTIFLVMVAPWSLPLPFGTQTLTTYVLRWRIWTDSPFEARCCNYPTMAPDLSARYFPHDALIFTYHRISSLRGLPAIMVCQLSSTTLSYRLWYSALRFVC